MYDDIEKAARDPYYRMLYTNNQVQKDLESTFKRMRVGQDEKPKSKQQADEQAKVICTHLNTKGLLTRSDYLLGLRYVRARSGRPPSGRGWRRPAPTISRSSTARGRGATGSAPCSAARSP